MDKTRKENDESATTTVGNTVERINVEAIVAEIRNEIKESGYTEELLSFKDIDPTQAVRKVNYTSSFDRIYFEEKVNACEIGWVINCQRDLAGGRAAVFAKRVVRKLTRFLVEPMAADQSAFNGNTAQALRQIAAYIDKKDEEIRQLKEALAQAQSEDTSTRASKQANKG